MRLTQKTEFALLAVFDLCLQRPGDLIKIAAIAGRQGILDEDPGIDPFEI